MIVGHEPGTGTGIGDQGAGDFPFSEPDGTPPSMLAGLMGETSDESPAALTPGPLGTEPGGGGPDSVNGWPGIGGFGDLPRGLFGGGGPGPSNPIFSLPPDDPPAPQPTPEPATIVLVGANVALLSALAWKRRRRGQETTSIG